MWYGLMQKLSKQTAKISANEPDTSDMQPLIHTWNLSAMCDGGEVPFAVRLERLMKRMQEFL